MTYEYNRTTGIALVALLQPGTDHFKPHAFQASPSITIAHPTRSTDRAGPAINCPPRENQENPQTPNPILRVQTLAYARVSLARAFRPAQKGHTLAQHQTDARGAHPDHPSCSTTVTVPGRSSRLQATTARDRPGEYVRHLVLLTRRSRCWSCCQLPGLPMARAGRLVTRSRPCGCDSTLCDQSIHCVQL